MAKKSKPYNDETRDLRERWMGRLQDEESAHKDWRKSAKEAREKYEDCDSKVEYNIYQSSVDILRGVALTKVPAPDVRRRYTEGGNAADEFATVVERCIGFYLDQQPAQDQADCVLVDRLVEGVGVAKLEIETKTAEAPVIDPITQGPMLGEDGQPILQMVIVDQFLRLRHWPAHRFRYEPAQTWDSVSWVCYDHELTKSEIEKKFGVKIQKYGNGKKTDTFTVHEIWDKDNKRRLFVSECYDGVLDDEEAPLNVKGFFPSTVPIFDTLKHKKLEPITWWTRVKKRVGRLDRMTKRIDALTNAIRDVGFYDAAFPELAQLEGAEDGTRVPVSNLIGRLNGDNSTDSVLVEVGHKSKAETLALLVTQRQNEEDLFFKDTGLSDIVRGASQASETATAQQIKAQWANVRLGPMTRQVSFFFRDLYRLMAEVLCEHFDPSVLSKAAGMEVNPQLLEAMREDLARSYIIDIETEATIALDEDEDRQQRLEALKVFSDYMASLMPGVQSGVVPADLAKEMLLFAVRSFKHGRQLEDLIESLPDGENQMQQLQQQVQQMQQQLQQAGQQIEQAQKALQQFQAGKEQRETALAQADVQLKNAQAQKTYAEAMKAGNPDPQSPPEDKTADNELKFSQARKTEAERVKIEVETALLPEKFQQEQEAALDARQDRANRFQLDREAAATGAPQPRRRRIRATVDGSPVEMDIED